MQRSNKQMIFNDTVSFVRELYKCGDLLEPWRAVVLDRLQADERIPGVWSRIARNYKVSLPAEYAWGAIVDLIVKIVNLHRAFDVQEELIAIQETKERRARAEAAKARSLAEFLKEHSLPLADYCDKLTYESHEAAEAMRNLYDDWVQVLRVQLTTIADQIERASHQKFMDSFFVSSQKKRSRWRLLLC